MLDSNNLIHWDNVCLTDPGLFLFQITKLSFRQTSRMSGQLESLVRVSVESVHCKTFFSYLVVALCSKTSQLIHGNLAFRVAH